MFCQEDTGENLKCPAEYSDRFQAVAYTSIAETLPEFKNLGCLPRKMNLDRMDEGDGIERTLSNRKAKFHKACNLKFNKSELKRASKRKLTVHDDRSVADTDVKFTRQKMTRNEDEHTKCFFCDQPATNVKPMRRASTFDIDTRVRQIAINLQDEYLIAKLSEGDMIATDAEYHVQCLVSLYNRERKRSKSHLGDSETNIANSTAFAELVSYIQCTLDDDGTASVFQLSALKKLYMDRVIQLGGQPAEIHSTRFKNQLLSYIPELEAHSEGRDVLLVANDNIGKLLRRSCMSGDDDEALCLSRAANIVRRDMFKNKCSPFSGTFPEHCQESSVAQSMLLLITMIMHGTNIKDKTNYTSQPALTVSQLLTYNSYVKRPKQTSAETKHSEQRETPLPLFIGALIHSRTRSKDHVDTMYRLGMSVSYDRVLGMSADLANSAISHFERVGSVCPPTLNTGVFTTSAVDNIDHDPSATSAHGSFHGTGISLFQHPDSETCGVKQTRVFDTSHSKKVQKLPMSYTFVPAISVKKGDPPVPEVSGLDHSGCSLVTEAVAEETSWCARISSIADTDISNDKEDIHVSWAAYHASNELACTTDHVPTAVSALLPLFPDDSKSIAMIRHSMDVVRDAVTILNPGQIPVIACDQPLFKLAKQIQWMWPETHGEDAFVVMLGGLHIKMTLLKALGDLLDGSGWTSTLVQANVATSGTADSFLKAAHIKRTARAHQLTACALFKLQHESYKAYQTSQQGIAAESFDEWCNQRAEESPQFHFWQLILKTELDVLVWDRSIHEGNFPLYVESLTRLEWLFHALDHYNYARAVAVHLRDMVMLCSKHPDVFAAFCEGKFTVNKTSRPFSRMSLDESHEQNNACVKSDGGAIGLTEKPAALLRWMVAGPEMSRVVGEFLCELDKKETSTQLRHHEDTPGKQVEFLKNVKSLVATMTDMGNPFSDTSGDLLVIDTREVVDVAVVDAVRKVDQLGEKQRDEFFKTRLVERTTQLSDRIPKNKLQLLKRRSEKDKSHSQEQVKSMKRDRNLFATLYIASQVRDADLDDFFQHENQSFPPSLSDCGNLRMGTKSDLLQCLEDLVPDDDDTSATEPVVDMIVVDGAAIVNMIKPGTAETFNDYTDEYSSYIRRQFTGSVRRVDVVFDIYKPDSLKAATRKKRGKGLRIRVEGTKKLPGNWAQFLREDGNKTELFGLISTNVIGQNFPGIVIITHGDGLHCSETIEHARMSPCTHEEADTRMLLHVADGVRQGYKNILIRTVDTDVVVLAVSLASKIGCERLFLGFGTGKCFRILDATRMAQALGNDRCNALPVFHALTGSDTTSSFAGRGKRTAWSTWNMFSEVTPALCTLAHTPTANDISKVLPQIERYIVLLYDRCSPDAAVNQARKTLFAQKNRQIENIPPTQDALSQHLLRVAYQAGHVWSQALLPAPQLPSPEDFGWKRNAGSIEWQIKWMTLPPAGAACRAVIRCGCVSVCRGRCKCLKEALPCTSLCKCGGCERDE
ncbi:MAG: hypothetical protein ABW185_18430 [Sedimenticola sp.]